MPRKKQSKEVELINVKLKKFNMKWIGDGKILIFIGKRKTGKSVLVLDYLYHNQDFPLGTVISPTDDYNWTFKPHIPAIFIHDEYSSELVEQVLKRQKDICKNCKIDPRYKGVDPRAFFIMDDCLADADGWVRDKNIRWIFMNGRHAQITFILTMQYAMGIPPVLRTNVDYIVICKESKLANQKRLYEHYAGMFPSFDMFRAILAQCTKDHGCLIIDNASTSEKLEDQVFWYRADTNKPGFNDFKLCYPIFWKDNQKYLQRKSDAPKASEKDQDDDDEEVDYNQIGKKNQINFQLKQLS